MRKWHYFLNVNLHSEMYVTSSGISSHSYFDIFMGFFLYFYVLGQLLFFLFHAISSECARPCPARLTYSAVKRGSEKGQRRGAAKRGSEEGQ